jgi:hypothetical protein
MSLQVEQPVEDSLVDEQMGFENPDLFDAEYSPTDDGGQVDEGSVDDTYFDLSQIADKKVRVKVDGDELDVPVSDLPNGYMRQADYTRKTQEAARIRQEASAALQLQQALQVDPQRTLSLLQQAFLGDEAAQAESDEFIDPLERELQYRYAEIDARISRFEEMELERGIASQVESMQQKFGDVFDPRAVIETAIRYGGIDLDTAFRLTVADQMLARQMAEGEMQQRRQAGDAERVSAKQQAAAVIASGAASAQGAAAPTSNQPSSVRDAWLQAKAELGIR